MILPCPGSGIPVARGETMTCLCGQSFARAAWVDGKIPNHSRPTRALDWEPLNQVTAEVLPDQAPLAAPAPWALSGRGNGHFDIIAANDTYVAHVYCWDKPEFEAVVAKIDKINGLGPMPQVGEVWRMTQRPIAVKGLPEFYDFEVLGRGYDLTYSAAGGTHKTFVMLRGLGHGDNVVELQHFRSAGRFTRLEPATPATTDSPTGTTL